MNKEFIIGEYLISIKESAVLVRTGSSEGKYLTVFEVDDSKYRLQDEVNDLIILHNKSANTMTVCIVYTNVIEMIEWSFMYSKCKIGYASYDKKIHSVSKKCSDEDGDKLLVIGEPEYISEPENITPIDTLTEFIELLKDIESDDSIKEQQYLTNGDYDKLPQILKSAIVAAEHLLISENGGCDWTSIRALKSAGYRVFAGEKDSFGWLTGCISTNKGIIVYG